MLSSPSSALLELMGVLPLAEWLGEAEQLLVLQNISSTSANNSATHFVNGQIGFAFAPFEVNELCYRLNPGLNACIFKDLRFCSCSQCTGRVFLQ